MNDLLAIILVGLVVLSAVVSVFVILTGPAKPYRESDYPCNESKRATGNGSSAGTTNRTTSSKKPETPETIKRTPASVD